VAKRNLLLPVLIAGLATKVDGSIKITLETRELDGDAAGRLYDLRNSEAWAVIAPSEQGAVMVDLPTEKADPAIGSKTPSQRLRAVIYRLWQQKGDQRDFESFYRVTLERVIDQFKEKLD
jgi:hypothetical protein